jgi:hypothetical protein
MNPPSRPNYPATYIAPTSKRGSTVRSSNGPRSRRLTRYLHCLFDLWADAFPCARLRLVSSIMLSQGEDLTPTGPGHIYPVLK